MVGEDDFYRFCPHSNSLHTVKTTLDKSAIIAGFWGSDLSFVDNAAAIRIISADFEATVFKYEKLGYKLALIEVGCALQHALLSISDQSLAGYAYAGIESEAMARLLQLSFPMEAPHV